MARLMLSAGMFSALAAATAPRRRGFFSTSPPFLAAIVISLIRRVKILPRLASSAPFLCLIVAHLEWPDIGEPRNLVSIGCSFRHKQAQRGVRVGEARTHWATRDYSIGPNRPGRERKQS